MVALSQDVRKIFPNLLLQHNKEKKRRGLFLLVNWYRNVKKKRQWLQQQLWNPTTEKKKRKRKSDLLSPPGVFGRVETGQVLVFFDDIHLFTRPTNRRRGSYSSVQTTEIFFNGRMFHFVTRNISHYFIFLKLNSVLKTFKYLLLLCIIFAKKMYLADCNIFWHLVRILLSPLMLRFFLFTYWLAS